MSYEISIVEQIDGTTQEYVTLHSDSGAKTFPADESNPDYQEWLASNSLADNSPSN